MMIAESELQKISAAKRKKLLDTSLATREARLKGSSTRRQERPRTSMVRQKRLPQMQPKRSATARWMLRIISAITSKNVLIQRRSYRFVSAGLLVAWVGAI